MSLKFNRFHIQSFLVGIICILLIAFSVEQVTGQQITLQRLSGIVTDESGGIIPDTTIKLINESDKTEYESISNENGRYIFTNIKPGKFELVAKATGFSKEHFKLIVKSEINNEFNIKLPVFGYGSEKIVQHLSNNEKLENHYCDLHKVRMKIDDVPITYGMLITATDNANDKKIKIDCKCPNTNNFYPGGCVIGEFTHIEMFYCPVCRKNEKKLFKQIETFYQNNSLN